MFFEQKDLFSKTRKDMETEVKAGLKWVLLAAALGLVLLSFYVMVARAHAASSDIAVRILRIDNEVLFDRHNRFAGLSAGIHAVNAIVTESRPLQPNTVSPVQASLPLVCLGARSGT